MPNIRKWIFNRKNLQHQVSKIVQNSIPNLQEKLQVINKWAGLAGTGEIKSRKETEMQGVFLFDIFGKVLGYKDFAGWPKQWNLNQEQSTTIEIDKMVYELYGLTDEEIRIVEGEV